MCVWSGSLGIDFPCLSALEDLCIKNNSRVIFLPKFHCEINPIEQYWGHANRVYRKYPLSSHEDVLEKNVLSAHVGAICKREYFINVVTLSFG